MFNRVFLSGLRAKALRRRVLFSALDELERGILFLAGRVVDCVRSGVLVRQLCLIVEKLGAAMRCGFLKRAEEIGVKQAVRLVEIAEGFGSKVAHNWLSCSGFFSYLTFLGMNR